MKYSVPTSFINNIDNIGFTIGAILVGIVLSYLMRRMFSLTYRSAQNRRLIPEAYISKTNTINSVLFSLLDVGIYGIALLIILSHWRVDISPILTGAGILGLAVSFGSQTLIKDVISGFFIISENQFNVGDRVKIDKHEGRVTKITLRLTVLKDDQGNRIYIPNSSISTVVRLKPIMKSPIIKNPKASLRKQKAS